MIVIHEAGDDVPIQTSDLTSAYSRNSTCVILYFIGDLVLHLHGMVSVLSVYNKIESPNTFIFRFPKVIRPLRHITEIRLKETTSL